MTVKIGVIGSREYVNMRKIKDVIFKLKERFGEDLEIVSGEQKQGADGMAKKIALELDMKYVSFPPAHYPYNSHCILEQTEYAKPYRVWNYSARNKQIAEYSDYIFAFIPKGKESKGTNDTIKHAKKLEKKVVVFN